MKLQNPPPASRTDMNACDASKKITRHAPSLFACITGLLACHATAATTVTYDFQALTANSNGNVSAEVNPRLSTQDNWTTDSTHLKVILEGSNRYAVGYDNAANIQNGNRKNNGAFSMTVPTAVTQFSLSADVRYGTFTSSGTQHRRSMFGMTVGSGSFLFGAAGDDTQDNKWLIQTGNGTQNFSSAVTTTSSSLLGIVRLEVNLSANSGNGSGSLYLNNVAINDLQNINLNLLSLATYSNGSSFDGMAISSGDFGRLDNLTLSYIPEPSTALLGSLGLLALLRRRRCF